MRNDREYAIYRAISNYMRVKYPKVIFRYDQAGLNLSKAQAGRQKEIQNGMKWPDLFIAKPVYPFHGAYYEIKKEGTVIWKKDGGIIADPHIQGQWDAILVLREQGYWADFSIGSDETIRLIDAYLK